MQTHGGAAAETAILGAERVFRAKVRVDWNSNGAYDHELSNLDRFIDDVSVDRSLTGSAPEEVLLIEGSGSAELVLNIYGEHNGMSLMAVFSPFNTRSPFAGVQTVDKEITYSLLLDTPLGTFEYPQFIGNIRTITPDRASAVVEITALDRVEKLRRPIQLPPFAISSQHIAYGEIDSLLVRADWVIDHCLKMCDIGAGNKRPTYKYELGLPPDAFQGTLFYASCVGSYTPNIGYLDRPATMTFANAGVPMYEQAAPLHPNAPAGTPRPLSLRGVGVPINSLGGWSPSDEGTLQYWMPDRHMMTSTAVHYLACTLNVNGADSAGYLQNIKTMLTGVAIGWGRGLNIYVQAGQVFAEIAGFDGRNAQGQMLSTVEATSPKVNIPNQPNVDIFLQWDLTPQTGSRVYLRAGTNSTGGYVAKGTAPNSPYLPNAGVTEVFVGGSANITHGVGVSDVFYAMQPSNASVAGDASFVYRTPKYLAILDRAQNEFSHFDVEKQREAWDLLQEVAAAEYGSVFWDENGVFRFWNWQTMLAKRNSIVRTYSLDDVEGLTLTNSLDSVRNIYSVMRTKARTGDMVKIYNSSDSNEFYVPARTDSIFRLWLTDVVTPWQGNLGRYASTAGTYSAWTDQLNHGFVVQFLSGSSWAENDSRGGVEAYQFYDTEGYLCLRVINRTDYPTRFAKNDGSAAAVMAGVKIEKSQAIEYRFENTESVQRFGPRALELTGQFYQDVPRADALFEGLLARTSDPAPATDAITTAGDPRLQLGDVVAVVDKDGFGDQLLLQVYGIRRSFSKDEGLTDVLTVEMVPPPGPPPMTEPDPDPGNPTETVTRLNLATNPSAAYNDDEWWGGSRVTGQTGMTRTTGMSYGSGTQVVAPKAKVSRGKTYRFSAQVKAPSGAVSGASIQIDWYTTGGYLATSQQANFSLSSGQVGRFYTPAVVAPLGATSALMTINGHSNTIVVGSVLYEETTAQGTYFDGDSPGGKWDGAAGNSSSRIVQEV